MRRRIGASVGEAQRQPPYWSLHCPRSGPIADYPMMDPDLKPITVALAELTDAELDGLARAIEHAPPLPAGLLAYVVHALDHKRAWRDGPDYPLRGPSEAIPDDELGESFAALAMLMVQFTDAPACARCSRRSAMYSAGPTRRRCTSRRTGRADRLRRGATAWSRRAS